MVKKTKKSRTQSPAVRIVEKLQLGVEAAQQKLLKRYEKSLRITQKNTKQLSSQIEKTQKARTASKPMRGRKPAKNAIKILENKLKAAQADLDFLDLGYRKLLAQEKAITVFEKEWKKTGAKVASSKKLPKVKERKAKNTASRKPKTKTESPTAYDEATTAIEHEVEMG